ncbi:MAG TPA: hypothetical protein VFW45_03590 [Candidatus Polarisedimenticolia bacterium]|nr:hypothetical protein [Candidatus Polarisedimenticolia bacterium]
MQNLNAKLETQADAVERVAHQLTDPAARERAGLVARDLRATQTSAQRIGARLGKNAEAQKSLQREIIRQFPKY